MPFTAHLLELRRRAVIYVAALLVGFLLCFYVSEVLFKFMILPMRSDVMFMAEYPFLKFVAKEKAITTLVFLAPAEAFWTHMKVAFIASLVATFPVLMFQVWSFISPGLVARERRFAFPFLFVSSGLFLMGTAFCFFLVLPFAMSFLLTYKTESLTPMISVEKYMDFCLKFILAFGVVFELPVVIVFLTRMGVVTPQWLARNRKYAIVLAFVAAALLTPTPDAFNQILMAVPIIFLYEGGILASRFFMIRKETSAHDD